MDSSKMRFDLSKIPQGKTVIGYFTELAQYEEFKDKKKDTLARIAIWSTDENSPFVKAERDDYERLIQNICDHLNFKDQKLIKEITENTNPDFNAMVNRVIIHCDNLVYVMWRDKFMMFHYIGMVLRSPVDMKNMERDMDKRAGLEKKREEIHKSLVEYEAQVFPNTFARKIVRKETAKLLQMAEKYAQDKTVV